MATNIVRAVRSARSDPGLFVLAARAYLLLVAMRVVITVLPLRRIAPHLGEPMRETPRAGVPPEQLRLAKRIGRVIERLARFTPTTSNCYPQALTARLLLHRAGVPTTLYYGAAFDDPGSTALQAHVWLRCGKLIVTGGATDRRFAPLSWYADEPNTAGVRRIAERSDPVVQCRPARREGGRWPRPW